MNSMENQPKWQQMNENRLTEIVETMQIAAFITYLLCFFAME